ncbi:MAG: hypothetical protein IJ368_03530 [Oscillospiraceae bacterium]|nr:hypothetical protein [Oscillospiraceae bacterium]
MYNFTLRIETTDGVQIIKRNTAASTVSNAARKITNDILDEYGKANVISVEALSYIYMEV